MAVLNAERTTLQVTQAEMAGNLRAQKGATMVTIVSQTDPARYKKDKGRFVKQSTVNGVINWNYEKAVNRQQSREGGDATFEAKPRKWGQRIKGTPLVEHKGHLYLEIKIERVLSTEYFVRRPVDGAFQTVTKNEISQYLKPSRSSAANQGVSKEIILRDYKLENVTIIRMNGIEFSIK